MASSMCCSRTDNGDVNRGTLCADWSHYHSFFDWIALIELELELAEELKSHLPQMKTGKIVFGHSGSDIVEKALRLVRFATDRPMIISHFEAHHGATAGAISASPTLQEMGTNIIARFFQLPGFLYMPFPDEYRPWFGEGSGVGKASLAYLERLLNSVISPGTCCGNNR